MQPYFLSLYTAVFSRLASDCQARARRVLSTYISCIYIYPIIYIGTYISYHIYRYILRARPWKRERGARASPVLTLETDTFLDFAATSLWPLINSLFLLARARAQKTPFVLWAVWRERESKKRRRYIREIFRFCKYGDGFFRCMN